MTRRPNGPGACRVSPCGPRRKGEEVPGVVDTVPRQVVARVGATTTTWTETWRER